MGFLIYGRGAEISFPDRALAHLQVVVSAKLRRNESFFFSWRDAVSTGGGRNAIWLDRSIPLQFRYSGTERQEPLNRAWIDALTASACTPAGLQFMAEPADAADSLVGDDRLE